uniref:LAGLIDADG endonuclease n=1 Tax=Juglanconis sp. TaxID=2041886 RepID=A0A291LIH8_9PEZI|nr:LAGLIDADG endonuclease [Juglanconis sp.]
MFRVSSIPQIQNVIIPHFDKYPLVTQKLADYLLFRDAIKLISHKEHLSTEGLYSIINIKASLNRGLSAKLNEAFPNSVKVSRPIVANQRIPHSMWIAGFTSAEGCFLVSLFKSTTKLGITPRLVFSITQHTRDEEILQNLVTYFGCGRYAKRTTGEAGDFICSKLSDIVEKIIPFFYEYPIIGYKEKNLEDWKKVANLIKSKAHLTQEGLDLISKLKSDMNK